MASAFQDTLDAIDRLFGEPAIVLDLKRRVRKVLRLGAGHPAVRARYHGRAVQFGCSTLHQAIREADRRYLLELHSFQIAAGLGHGSRLSVMVLEEVRLILRWLRRAGLEAEFSDILAELRADEQIDPPLGQFEATAARRQARAS